MTFLKVISWLILFYGLAGLIINLVRPAGSQKSKFPFVFPSLITGLFLVVILSLIILIDAQQVGVLIRPSGVQDEELHTGWHIMAPWNEVHKMDKTVWVYT